MIYMFLIYNYSSNQSLLLHARNDDFSSIQEKIVKKAF